MNRIRVGVIGAGDWGKNHLRVFSKLDCDLVGVADTNKDINKVAIEHKIKFFTSYKKLIEEVDAVSVVAPTQLHYKIVKECLNSHKHVLVEKPITLKSRQARELLDMAASKSLVLQIGYLFRFNAAVLELKKLMPEVGDVQYVTSHYTHSSKPPRKDSGAIFNFAVHMFDTIAFILNRVPKSIYAKKLNYLSKEREDAAIIVMDYGDMFATLEVSWLHPSKRRDIWVIGSREKVYADLLEQCVRRYPKIITYEKTVEKPPFDMEVHKNEPLYEELKSFLATVGSWQRCGDLRMAAAGKKHYDEDYLASLLCELSLRSAASRREISIDPKTAK